jgi:uncharacterized membrane protein (UPF0127 family)
MLMNTRTGGVVADTVEVADTRETRRRGLLGRDGMAPSSALMISPCFAVHTAFMRFAIDVAFVDGNGDVVRMVRDMGPWRMAVAWRGRRVIEMPAGELEKRDVRLGDRLYLNPLASS